MDASVSLLYTIVGRLYIDTSESVYNLVPLYRRCKIRTLKIEAKRKDSFMLPLVRHAVVFNLYSSMVS